LFVAACDFMKTLPMSIARWVPGPYVALGTDGYGLSESRAALRKHFEVDAEHIYLAALSALADEGHLDRERVKALIAHVGIDCQKPDSSRAGPAEYPR
jgi:pyruvate dehydrogenase E1 component